MQQFSILSVAYEAVQNKGLVAHYYQRVLLGCTIAVLHYLGLKSFQSMWSVSYGVLLRYITWVSQLLQFPSLNGI